MAAPEIGTDIWGPAKRSLAVPEPDDMGGPCVMFWLVAAIYSTCTFGVELGSWV